MPAHSLFKDQRIEPMAIYLLYHTSDTEFATQLSNDLSHQSIFVTHGYPEQMTPNDKLVVLLSAASVADAEILAQATAARQLRVDVVALRISDFPEMPENLKGILPLNFTSREDYSDSIQSLIEDVAPTTKPLSPFPKEVQTILGDLHVSDAEQRKRAIQKLSSLRTHPSHEVREVAKQALSDLVFKDKDPLVKQLAGVALQSFGVERTTSIEATPPPMQDRVEEIFEDVEPALPVLSTAHPLSLPASMKMGLWSSPTWKLLPIVSIILGVLHALAAKSIPIGLTLAVVGLVLAWVNIQIRDGGKFVWQMPGPLIGNALIGFIITGVVGGISTLIFSGMSFIAFLALCLLGVVYGVLIGWVSELPNPL
jgi:hypothetical protein